MSAIPFALIPAALFPTSLVAQEADRIWLGGPTLTMEDDTLTVRDGLILAVSSGSEVMAQRGTATELIDRDGHVESSIRMVASYFGPSRERSERLGAHAQWWESVSASTDSLART